MVKFNDNDAKRWERMFSNITLIFNEKIKTFEDKKKE